jgi:prepilin-type N-terminal cleavage/methylation domain-containing protein
VRFPDRIVPYRPSGGDVTMNTHLRGVRLAASNSFVEKQIDARRRADHPRGSFARNHHCIPTTDGPQKSRLSLASGRRRFAGSSADPTFLDALLPLPVLRERAGVRVYSSDQNRSTFQITLSPTLRLKTVFDVPITLARAADSGGHLRRRRGFTLIEALAAMTLLAIVMPALTQSLSVATQAASSARHHTEATQLAQQQMSELLATGAWQQGTLSGDFSPDWPQYQWQATVQTWVGDTTGTTGLQEIDLRVSWLDRNATDSITLATLVYPGAQQTTSTSTSTQ